MSRPTPSFDSHADSYEMELAQGLALSGEPKSYFAAGRVSFLTSALRSAGRPEPRVVVDYGCGLGDVTALLAAAFPGARLLGLDPSARCVARARERFSSNRVRFGVLGELSPERADLVHLNGVVHHVAPADRAALFADLRERTRSGGTVALFENNPLNPGTRLVMARIPFDRGAVPLRAGEARCRLREAGFVPFSTRYLFWFPRALRALRLIEPALARIPLGAQYGVLATAAERVEDSTPGDLVTSASLP